MHKKSSALIALVLMLCLIAASLAWGAHRGWTQERKQVDSTMGALLLVLDARSEVGANIVTVARRHLQSGDPQLQALRQDIQVLSEDGSLAQKAQANGRFDENARAVLTALAALPSVQDDARDLQYVTQMLPQALEQSERLAEQAAYNQAATDFNQGLTGSFSGRIAQLLGITRAELITQQEGI